MSRPASAASGGAGTLALGAGLLAIALPAWFEVVRESSSMSMPGAAPSLAAGALFTVQWGVMMTAMMLPSAAPMILLYRTVVRRLSAEGDRVLHPALFAAVYLLLWLAVGVPVYAAQVAVVSASARWSHVGRLIPYAVAGVLAGAGAYQLTSAKRACLRKCESPLGFLMRRWHSSYAATLRLACLHAGYCIGCCWGLMAILVAAGAMSLPWVVAITIIVFVEKMLPRHWRTAQLVGGALLALALFVALHPAAAGAIRPHMQPMSENPMSQAMRHSMGQATR